MTNSGTLGDRETEMKNLVEQALAVMRGADFASDAYEIGAFAAWQALSPAHRETLDQLLDRGPIWDGDVVSKSARDDLLRWGLATRCCFRREQGYVAATYNAFVVSGRGKERRVP